MAGVSVVISATDRTSGVFGKVNTGLDSFTRRIEASRAPMNRMNASLGRFGQVTGISEAASNVGNLGRRIASAAGDLGRFAPALAGLASAGTVAGLASMVNKWTEFSTRLGLDARRIGVTAQNLHGLQGAARLAGSSAEALTGGMEELGGNLVDAVGGRNSGVVAMLSTLGIGFQNASTGGARLAQDVLPEIADRISKLPNPFLRARAATTLFGGAGRDLLPFLERGSAGIRELTALSERYGLTNDRGVQGARDMARAQTQMSMAVEGVGYAVSERVAPILVPMLNQLSEWISANRGDIAKFFGDVASGIKAWVDDGGLSRFLGRLEAVYNTLKRIVDIADAVGHGLRKAWDSGEGKRLIDEYGNPIGPAGAPIPGLPASPGGAPAALGPGGHLRDGWIERNMPTWLGGRPASAAPGSASTPAPTSAEQEDRGRRARDQLVGLGWTPEQATGIVANIHKESGFNPGAVGDGGSAYGLVQAHPERRANMERALGHSLIGSSQEEQIRGIDWELRNTEKAAGDRIRATKTAAEAGAATSLYYERPAAMIAEASERAASASRWERRLAAPPVYGSSPTPVPFATPAPPAPAVQPAPAPVASPGAQGQPGPDGKATVRLHFENPPAGLQTTTMAEGGLRIERPQLGSMP